MDTKSANKDSMSPEHGDAGRQPDPSGAVALPDWLARWIPTGPESSSLLIFLLLILLCLSAANYAANGIFYPLLHIGTDFPSLYAGAEVVRQGGNPYDMEVFHRTSTELGLGEAKPYVYHPLAAYVLIPLTLFPPEWANAIFAVLNLLLLIAAVWLGTQRRTPRRSAWLVLGLVLAANYSPIHNTVRLGRVDVLVLLLLFLALYWLKDSRPWLGGAAVGAAVMLKMTPALLLVYLLWKRRWRAFISASTICLLIAGLGLMVAGPETNKVFWQGITAGTLVPAVREQDSMLVEFYQRSYEGSETLGEFMERLPGHPQNLSLAGIAAHLFDSPYTEGWASSPSLARGLSLVASFLLLATMFWLTRPSKAISDGTTRLELEFGLVVTVLVLIPTIAWEHHMTLLLLPLLVLSRGILSSEGAAHSTELQTALAICYTGLAVNYGYWVSEFRSGPWIPLMSAKTFFALLLFGLMAWWLSRTD